MVVIARPFRFDGDDPRPMLRHLDGWARKALATPEGWASVLERCGQWVDRSPRNQVLLASYGVVGQVAGSATWATVASTEEGRPCAVRSGEHGLPIRVPVLDSDGVTSERSRAGGRSRTVAATWRWEQVYAVEQLARRPALSELSVAAVRAMSERDRLEAVRVASGRMLGRTPRKIGEPFEQLAMLAGRVHHGSGRVRLSRELATQAAWLVADRVGWAPGAMVTFDPGSLSARERWRTAVDVRYATDRLLVAVSHAIGVDLTASPLPRHDFVDDQVVAPGRRNYLAPADVRALPIGVWVEAGPYTRGEWLARGVAGGAGVAAFLRVNDRSYLAAYETKAGAMWRLETSGRGAHHGLVAEGTAEDLLAAKDGARAALAERYPEAAQVVELDFTASVVSPAMGWVAVPGRDDRSERRVFDERVAAMVSPGPGGRWQTWVTVDGTPRQGPLEATSADARSASETLAKGALMELATHTPDRANALVYDLATTDVWERGQLVALVGHRLTDSDRSELAATDNPARLVELMCKVSVLAPVTMMHVLHAEGVGASTAIELVPSIGLAAPDAIRMLHGEWGTGRLDAGIALGATVEELRTAGCSSTELLTVAPREELRRLDGREHTWTLVGPTLVEAGYTPAEAVDQLAAHAPSPVAFAAGVTAIVDDPTTAFSYASRRASVADLATLAERYALDPADVAAVMSTSGFAAADTVAVLAALCPNDTEWTVELAGRFYDRADVEVAAAADDGRRADVVPIRTIIDRGQTALSLGVDL